VWITRSCVDVTCQLSDALAEVDALSRANRVRDRRQEIAKQAEDAAAAAAAADGGGGCRCEVQEMWADKSYVLFTYERLRDVRIVYVPPLSLGNFGGDTDNFEWPRHTADFTLMRAYVSPSGSPAPPSPSNIPYRPRRHISISPTGAAVGDFVFLLGFPGSTMRYAPVCRLHHL